MAPELTDIYKSFSDFSGRRYERPGCNRVTLQKHVHQTETARVNSVYR